ncbi:hypothetical protein [Patiriisocius hiemis]|uniref:Uncharacterized protein n=1 Tax=Patiriisocius hiemis TaxID=3075604 RepID=A0ABU2YAR7_9FLAO|nr:hypothetical protein [Constantimarinum sp. W242]MDT0554837.1 hypothetical protein [Constantimarinum sp. W242]
MKRYILFLLLLCNTIVHGQDIQQKAIVVADSSWGKEIIPFPISWAPKVHLTGYEELRFAPEWSNPKSDDFWSLIMSWKVDAKQSITTEVIVANLAGYFDGLMKPNHWAQEFPSPQVIIQNITKENTVFRMKFFDGFHTGKVITVSVVATQTYCKEIGKSIINLRFSPKDFNNPIWDALNKIEVQKDICTN